MPFAWELLRRCAFFGPEPIQRDLLNNGRYVLGPPLQAGLGDSIMISRATRKLGHHALARVDNHRRTLQIHRLIQMLIREEMEPSEVEPVRHEVHLLLAAAEPHDMSWREPPAGQRPRRSRSTPGSEARRGVSRGW